MAATASPFSTKLGTFPENYMLSADGYLMPAKKGQKPPDLRYFNRAKQ